MSCVAIRSACMRHDFAWCHEKKLNGFSVPVLLQKISGDRVNDILVFLRLKLKKS
jgi:hypothetical protein